MIVRGWFRGLERTPVLKDVQINEQMFDWIDYHGQIKVEDSHEAVATVHLCEDFNGPSTTFYITHWNVTIDLKNLVETPKPASKPATKAKTKDVRSGSNNKNNGSKHKSDNPKSPKSLPKS